MSAAWLRHSVIALVSVCVGCGGGGERSIHTARMGDRVELAPFVYNVVDARWETHVGEGPTAALPRNRFLVVRLTAVNSGASAAAVPGLVLEDDAGQLFQESGDGAGLPDWLGMIRTVKPADVLEGTVVFDVEPRSYRLRLGDEFDQARAALVELPLYFETAPGVSLHDEPQQNTDPAYADWMQNARRP